MMEDRNTEAWGSDHSPGGTPNKGILCIDLLWPHRESVEVSWNILYARYGAKVKTYRYRWREYCTSALEPQNMRGFDITRVTLQYDHTIMNMNLMCAPLCIQCWLNRLQSTSALSFQCPSHSTPHPPIVHQQGSFSVTLDNIIQSLWRIICLHPFD